MSRELDPRVGDSLHAVDEIVRLMADGRAEILADWVERVRDNRAVRSGQALSEPLLLDHVPQLFDSIVARLEVNRSRAEADQWAAIHGFSRRVTGYDVVETVIELSMLRRALWSHLSAVDAPLAGLVAAMERVDGMLDRAMITSLQAFLDPAARMLIRGGPDEPDGPLRLAPLPAGNPPR
jgi:hypothetical protein